MHRDACNTQPIGDDEQTSMITLRPDADRQKSTPSRRWQVQFERWKKGGPLAAVEFRSTRATPPVPRLCWRKRIQG